MNPNSREKAGSSNAVCYISLWSIVVLLGLPLTRAIACFVY